MLVRPLRALLFWWLQMATLAPVSAQVPSAPGSPGASASALSPEAAACARAALSAPFVPLAGRFGHVSRACAALFREPECRAAWRTAADQPASSRAAHLIEACRSVYCPLLSPPPSLCVGELTPARMLAEGAPLIHAALARDHGPDFAAAMAGLIPPPAATP